MPTAHLADRGVVRVFGPDARSLLDGLITCDLDKVLEQKARPGALLTPLGRRSDDDGNRRPGAGPTAAAAPDRS